MRPMGANEAMGAMRPMSYRPPLIGPIWLISLISPISLISLISSISPIKIYGAGPIPGNFINLISYVNLQSS